MAGVMISGRSAPCSGGEQADPDTLDLRAVNPETQELFHVSGTAGDLTGDGAVDGDAALTDGVENPFVGGGLATLIMLGLKAIDGNHQAQLFELRPGFGQRAKGAGDHLDVDTATLELGQQHLELAVTDQGVAAYDGEMERLSRSTMASSRRTRSSPL